MISYCPFTPLIHTPNTEKFSVCINVDLLGRILQPLSLDPLVHLSTTTMAHVSDHGANLYSLPLMNKRFHPPDASFHPVFC